MPLLLGLFFASASAAGELYVAENTTYYVNPVSGAAHDGGDTSIGEGMCRNATYQYTLIEKDGGGAYVTLRLKSAAFLKDIAVSVQTAAGADEWRGVPYTEVGRGADGSTVDVRFRVDSPDLYIKPEFYVEPMKRGVTYYVGLNGASSREEELLALFGKTADVSRDEPTEDGAENPADAPPPKPTETAVAATGGDVPALAVVNTVAPVAEVAQAEESEDAEEAAAPTEPSAQAEKDVGIWVIVISVAFAAVLVTIGGMLQKKWR
jgi:hypothetical protein